MSTWRKWKAIYNIYFQESMAYRANAMIWALTDTIPAAIMPLAWLSAYGGRSQIAGFDPKQMVTYYMMVLLFTNFITCHLMWEMAWEIKEGIWSTLLIRPVSVFEMYLVRNFSWRIVRTIVFVPMLIMLLLAYHNMFDFGHLYFGWELWASVILGHLVSFCFVFAMGLLALWFQETHSLFGLYYIPMLFLSGQMFPLSMLPKWAFILGALFPFRYTTAFPTEIAIGRTTGAAMYQGMLLQIAWIVISLLAAQVLWRRGIKQYTGVGM